MDRDGSRNLLCDSRQEQCLGTDPPASEVHRAHLLELLDHACAVAAERGGKVLEGDDPIIDRGAIDCWEEDGRAVCSLSVDLSAVDVDPDGAGMQIIERLRKLADQLEAA